MKETDGNCNIYSIDKANIMFDCFEKLWERKPNESNEIKVSELKICR